VWWKKEGETRKVRKKRGESKKGDGIQSSTEEYREEVRSAYGERWCDSSGIDSESEEESQSSRRKPQPEKGEGLTWDDIRHFTPSDFMCRCEGYCDHKPRIDLSFVRKLDEIREQLGLPMSITSGTRCSAFNQRVIGGSPSSAHVPNGDGLSRAADITVPTAEYLHKILSLAFDMGITGIGIGKGWVHLEDTARSPAVWTYPPMRRK